MNCPCPTCGQDLPTATGIAIDTETGAIVGAGRAIHLTRREEAVLGALMRAAPRIVEKWALVDAVYTLDADEPETAYKCMDVVICRLRKKLQDIPGVCIETIWGRGFRLALARPAPE